jgi:hypothetical protein
LLKLRGCKHLEMGLANIATDCQNENGPARLISRQPDADWKKGMIPVRTVLFVTKLPLGASTRGHPRRPYFCSNAGIAMTAVMEDDTGCC